jgi:hypothetical protein
MSQSFRPQNRIEPLSVGNTVTVGFSLYRSHLKSFFLLAVISSLWLFLPLLFLVPAGVVLFVNTLSGSNLFLAWAIVIIIGLVTYFYALGKSLINSAVISRLAFCELVNHPETVTAARHQIQPKLWSFIIPLLLLLGIFLVLSVGLLVVGLIITLLISFFVGAVSPSVALPIIFILNLFITLAIIVMILWLAIRWFIWDAILAIEENTGAIATISRSWDITKRNEWRIFLILLVAFVITIPWQILVQLINRVIINAFILPTLPEDRIGDIANITTMSPLIIIFYLLTIVIIFLANAIILPFWQAIKAVIYYDLRSRGEGLGLKLRDREI